MEHKEMKLNKMTIYGTVDKLNYVEMLVPEGWTSQINTYDTYAGYSFPHTFTITNRSLDKTASIYYYSTRAYLDDHLHSFKDKSIDDYGNLMMHFMEAEQYLDSVANNAIGKYEDFGFVKQFDYTSNVQYENNKQEKLKQCKNNNEVLNWYYYKRIVRVYKYKYNNYERRRCYSILLEGTDTTRWNRVPNQEMFRYDPFMLQSMQSVFPNFQLDNQTNSYVYTGSSETYWMVKQYLCMDCLERDFDYLYENAFIPVKNECVTICDDIWNLFNKEKEENKKKYAAIRADKKKASEIQRKANEERRQKNKELYEYVRNTQKQTHDMINDSYEKKRKSDAKIREMWSDTILDNTRFVDKYGDEHVVHTLDRHVYKKGDDYITSNSSLDLGYDWEELEKKKY